MKPLREFLDKLEPLFTKGGRFEQFHALFEAVDTFLYSPGDLSRGSPHVRDALDLKRVMITVVIAAMPAAIMGMYEFCRQRAGSQSPESPVPPTSAPPTEP